MMRECYSIPRALPPIPPVTPTHHPLRRLPHLLFLLFLFSLTSCSSGVTAQSKSERVYPMLGSIPDTAFRCRGYAAGYYADLETGCQVYHMCDTLGKQYSYLCPNHTLFNQKFMVCDHWYMVNCPEAIDYYHLNNHIGQESGEKNEGKENNIAISPFKPSISSLKPSFSSPLKPSIPPSSSLKPSFSPSPSIKPTLSSASLKPTTSSVSPSKPPFSNSSLRTSQSPSISSSPSSSPLRPFLSPSTTQSKSPSLSTPPFTSSPSSPSTRFPSTSSPSTRFPSTLSPSSPSTRFPSTFSPSSPSTRFPSTSSPLTKFPSPSSPSTRFPSNFSPSSRFPPTSSPSSPPSSPSPKLTSTSSVSFSLRPSPSSSTKSSSETSAKRPFPPPSSALKPFVASPPPNSSFSSPLPPKTPFFTSFLPHLTPSSFSPPPPPPAPPSPSPTRTPFTPFPPLSPNIPLFSSSPATPFSFSPTSPGPPLSPSPPPPQIPFSPSIPPSLPSTSPIVPPFLPPRPSPSSIPPSRPSTPSISRVSFTPTPRPSISPFKHFPSSTISPSTPLRPISSSRPSFNSSIPRISPSFNSSIPFSTSPFPPTSQFSFHQSTFSLAKNLSSLPSTSLTPPPTPSPVFRIRFPPSAMLKPLQPPSLDPPSRLTLSTEQVQQSDTRTDSQNTRTESQNTRTESQNTRTDSQNIHSSGSPHRPSFGNSPVPRFPDFVETPSRFFSLPQFPFSPSTQNITRTDTNKNSGESSTENDGKTDNIDSTTTQSPEPEKQFTMMPANVARKPGNRLFFSSNRDTKPVLSPEDLQQIVFRPLVARPFIKLRNINSGSPEISEEGEDKPNGTSSLVPKLSEVPRVRFSSHSNSVDSFVNPRTFSNSSRTLSTNNTSKLPSLSDLPFPPLFPFSTINISTSLTPPLHAISPIKRVKQEFPTPLSVPVRGRNTQFLIPSAPMKFQSTSRGNRQFFIPSLSFNHNVRTQGRRNHRRGSSRERNIEGNNRDTLKTSNKENENSDHIDNDDEDDNDMFKMTMVFPPPPETRMEELKLNPECPRCHPAFLRPGQCKPCVLIK